jgi:hypothetical protein
MPEIRQSNTWKPSIRRRFSRSAEAERTIQNLNVTPAENRVKSTFPG